MKKLTILLTLQALNFTTTATATDYDLVINNGRVMDPETKFDQVDNVGVKDGKIAVITKDKITGKETIDAKGMLPSTGIKHVIVNGTIVMKDQKPLKGVNPGQPIRFEPVKSKFEPLTKEGWTQTYYASPIDLGGGVPGYDVH